MKNLFYYDIMKYMYICIMYYNIKRISLKFEKKRKYLIRYLYEI